MDEELDNMYAVIEANGRPLIVKEGDVVRLDRISGDPGHEIVFERVLLAHDGRQLLLAPAALQKARVTARVLRQTRAPKILAFRYKSKKRVRRRHGHRQPVTELRIESIALG
jgi:large subunit ribosomal protein L21